MASFASEKTKALEQGKNQFSQSFYKAMESPIKDGNESYQHCILERHEDTMSFPLLSFFNVRPLATYSIRFKKASNDEDDAMPEGETRLWARRQIFAKKAYYIFSAHPEDLTCKESERSEFFLGTMTKKFEGRMFKGFAKEGDMKCVVMYDHERSSVDNKMEVAVPRDNTKPCPSLLDDFSKIRQEGSANHHSTKDIVIYQERDSDREKAKKGETIKGESNSHVSVKNFQLIKSKPQKRFESIYIEKPVTTSGEKGDAAINATPVQDTYVDSDDEKDGDNICLQMIKLEKDVFDCKYKAPFTLLQAFQVCLSRFETQQIF